MEGTRDFDNQVEIRLKHAVNELNGLKNVQSFLILANGDRNGKDSLLVAQCGTKEEIGFMLGKYGLDTPGASDFFDKELMLTVRLAIALSNTKDPDAAMDHLDAIIKGMKESANEAD